MESKERIDKEFNEQIEQLKHYANGSRLGDSVAYYKL